MTANAKVTLAAGIGALLIATGAAPLSAQAAEIIVYQDAYYSGASRHFTDNVRNLGNEGFNDRISSIRVVSGFWTVCTDADYGGRCESVSGDVSNLDATGLNDRISSLRVESSGWDNNNDGDGLILYDDYSFRGRAVSITEDTPGLGSYSFNDRASSIHVQGGTWEICRDTNYGGSCETISDDVSNLNVFSLNNQISSVRLVRSSNTNRQGSWWQRNRNDRWARWNNRDYRAEVYEHANFGGQSREFNGAVPDLGRYGLNNRISSFHLEGRWQVCDRPNFAGECQVFRFDEDNLSSTGWNDRISSMRPIGIGAGGGGGQGQQSALILFEDVNYQGDREQIDEDVPDMRTIGFDNIASSMRIREGRWQLCSDTNYRGECHTFTSDSDNFIPLGLNDQVSSVRRLDDGASGGYNQGRGITIFEDDNYQGRSLNFTSDAPNLANQNFNDMLSSFRIYEGTWQLCEHAYYSGQCWTYNSDEDHVGSQGMNDRVSSLRRVDSGGGSGGSGYDARIVVYQDVNYGGRSRTYTSTVSNLAQDGWNDMISSFRVYGPGHWEICEHADFGGRCQVFNSDEPTMVPLNWNDRISSIRYLP